MKAYLLFSDKDFNWEERENKFSDIVIRDLEMEEIYQKMAEGNNEIYHSVRKVCGIPIYDKIEILYRQDVLKDCIDNPWIFELFDDLVGQMSKKEKELCHFGILSDYPSAKVSSSIEILNAYLSELKKFRSIVSEKTDKMYSKGFQDLFARILSELNDQFFEEAKMHIEICKFRYGVEVAGSIGTGMKPVKYKLLKRESTKASVIERWFGSGRKSYRFWIADRDEAGSSALSELEQKALNEIASVLAQSVEHIKSFADAIQKELAFYKGCVNLYNFLLSLEMPVSYPVFLENGNLPAYEQLYDVALSARKNGKVAGNSSRNVQEETVIITGANQGGKTTFLRSIGQCILMAQCGMFVGAFECRTIIYNGLFTHFRKEEDEALNSGKLDEELMRMSEIIDVISPRSCILFNESFAATNEREGTEIAYQVLKALEDNHISIYFVTHLYALAQKYMTEDRNRVLFLRANREEDGSRTFQLQEGEPLKTGYGTDIYYKLFGDDN